MRVIGTAGHVDHGKSALVQALTGIDPDRLKEEKARGMTIELGFAWIDLPRYDGGLPTGEIQNVGIVDVPGHIDFIKNMLAGVGGVDAAMLVIAADEGVMPQTREHLAILDLLAVPAAVVALTKIDLIDDPEWLDLVELDVVELLQDTHLASAPIIRVSAMSAEGQDDLRQALGKTLGTLPPRRNRARPRLPIDRVFSISGFGTIVTGTLMDGHFSVGDAVEIAPSGAEARIRGLQTHGERVDTGEPGSRLAINLSNIGTDEIRRGEVVVKPGTVRSTVLVDVSFRLLADAVKPLVHNQAVDFFVGASEVSARVRLLGAEQIELGQEGWLQLRLDRPLAVAAGDRFILRQPSPSSTLGGGLVLNAHPRRRWKRFDPDALNQFKTLARGLPDEVLLQTLARNPFSSESDLIAQSSLDLETAEEALGELCTTGAVVEMGAGNDRRLVSVGAWVQTLQQLRDLLDAFHAEHPLRRGMPRGEARSRLQSATKQAKLSVRLFNAMLDQSQAVEEIESDDAFVWRHGFEVAPSANQQAHIDRTLAQFSAAPFSPPNAGDTLSLLANDAELLEMMVEQGTLVRLTGGVLFRTADFDTASKQIQAYINANGSITLAEARDLFDTSRKYAQALLEELDARRITRRDGDVRVMRVAAP
jgi:selenocysteine-specific elongation factor